MTKSSAIIVYFVTGFATLFAQWNASYIGTNGSGLQIQYLNQNCVIASQSEAIFINPEIPDYYYRIVNSYNNGSTWTSRYSHYAPAGQSYYSSNFSFFDGNNGVFAFKTGSNQVTRLYKTTNSGNTWSYSNIVLTESLYPVSIAYITSLDIAAIFRYGTGYNNHYLYLSTNAGSSWTFQLMPNPKTPRKIYFYDENSGYVISDSGVVLKTTNKGLNWTTSNTGYPYILRDISFFDSQNGVVVGGTSSQCYIFKTTNSGTTWNLNFNSNITGVLLSVSFKDPNCIYASGRKILGTSNGGVDWLEQAAFPSSYNGFISAWNKDTVIAIAKDNVYRTNIGIVTGFSQMGTEIPAYSTLKQNYPNPFNPVTKIEFVIHRPLHVQLVIYDILGRQLELLVDDNLNAGIYETEWNASKNSSGMYLCRLITDGKTETRRMTLVK